MVFNSHQKVVLAVAAVLAFGIWLFPHWQVHAWRSGLHRWKDAGYSFLFLPPQETANEVRRVSPYFNITVDIDWRRQFCEWGTLAFLTGFALAAIPFWHAVLAQAFTINPAED